MRLSGVYGSGKQEKTTINKLIESATRNKEVILYGDGKDKRDYIYVDDVCNIIKKAIEQKINATLNVATGNSCSISEIVEIIKKCCTDKFVVNYKQRENITEERVKDMVYDVSLLTTLFPDIKIKDLKEGISIIFKSAYGKC